ncbi:Kinesin-like protein KIF13B [Papilio xuthus]|uniref:Kinesin-like protein KIF13B n=1 Tax=Papilio xuthus TaxID=66420 RepID=A0A194PQ47_PAPXU|nr:Kinesin-like protein KIF13B [Papilio xuthus]
MDIFPRHTPGRYDNGGQAGATAPDVSGERPVVCLGWGRRRRRSVAAPYYVLRHIADSGNITKQPKTFAFDHCFYSLDSALPNFASQKTVFECLGRDILDNAFDGYNACIFAYGQTVRQIKCLSAMKTLEALDK